MGIELSDRGEFIEVRDNDTDIVHFLSKAGLIIKRISSSSLQLFSQGVSLMVSYSDVVSPATENILVLLDIIFDWVRNYYIENRNANIECENTCDDDQTGSDSTTPRLKIVKHDLQNTVISSLRDKIVITGDGSLSEDEILPQYVLQVQNEGDDVSITSKSRISFVSGIDVEASITLRIEDVSSFESNMILRFGMFDGKNGYCYQVDSDGLSVVTLQDGSVESKVLRSDFNISRLDSGSQNEINLDLSDVIVYHISISLFGPVKFAVTAKDNDGTMRRKDAHRLFVEDEGTGGMLQEKNKLNHPIHVQLTSGGSSEETCNVFLIGRSLAYVKRSPERLTRTSSAFRLNQILNQNNALTPLISVRVKSERFRFPVRITSFDMFADDVVLFQIHSNASLSNPEFKKPENIDESESTIEFDVSADSMTGGTMIYSGLAQRGTVAPVISGKTMQSLSIEADDVLTLAVRTFESDSSLGNVGVSSLMRVEEDW